MNEQILEIIKDNCKSEMRNHKENAADEIEAFIKENYVEKEFVEYITTHVELEISLGLWKAYKYWLENIKDK